MSQDILQSEYVTIFKTFSYEKQRSAFIVFPLKISKSVYPSTNGWLCFTVLINQTTIAPFYTVPKLMKENRTSHKRGLEAKCQGEQIQHISLVLRRQENEFDMQL